MANRPDNIVKIGEASRLLGLHPNTIRRWETEGKIQPLIRFRGKGTRYYDKEQLLAFAAGLGSSTVGKKFMTLEDIEKELGLDLTNAGWVLPEPHYDVEYIREKADQIREYNLALVEE